MARACFPNVSQFSIRETLFLVSAFCFKMQIIHYATRQGNFNKNPSMRALAKILRARASEHSPNFLRAIRAKAKFCEHFQIGWDHSIPLIYVLTDEHSYHDSLEARTRGGGGYDHYSPSSIYQHCTEAFCQTNIWSCFL